VNAGNVQLGISSLSVTCTDKGEDCWYTHDKWKDLPENKQAAIRKAHAARKIKGKGSKGPRPKGNFQTGKFGCKQFQKLDKKVQNQKLQLAVLQAERSAPKSDPEVPMNKGDSKEGDSHKHLALTCQRKVSCKGKGGNKS
jgi:hypothetical protein